MTPIKPVSKEGFNSQTLCMRNSDMWYAFERAYDIYLCFVRQTRKHLMNGSI